MDACKTVEVEGSPPLPLASKLVHLDQSFLAACFSMASWPVAANGKKVLTAEGKETCTLWVEWRGPDPVTFGGN